MGDCAEGFRFALAKPAQANLLVYVDTPTLECWAVKTEKMLRFVDSLILNCISHAQEKK